MNDHSRALQLWPKSALSFAEQAVQTGAMHLWSQPELAGDELVFSFTGRRYTLRLAPRVVGLTTDGILSVQTSLRCTSRLAETLAAELRLHECWDQGAYYRLGTLTLFVEWFAANAATPPTFIPTRWAVPPSTEEIHSWLSLLEPLRNLVEGVRADAPLFPTLNAMALTEVRIPGSKPQWGSSFDRLVCAMDSNSTAEVIQQLKAELQARRAPACAQGGSDPIACELHRLLTWLSSSARAQ